MNTDSGHQVRRADVADAALLAALRWEFRSSVGTPAELVESEVDFVARCIHWMSLHLADEGRWRAYIAKRSGVDIGAVWLQLIEKIPNPIVEPEVHGYVTNFFVRPEHRNGGVGSTLLAALIADCEKLSVDALFLWARPGSEALYERHGFSGENSVMVRERG